MRGDKADALGGTAKRDHGRVKASDEAFRQAAQFLRILHKQNIPMQAKRTLRGQALAGYVDEAWRGLDKIKKGGGGDDS